MSISDVTDLGSRISKSLGASSSLLDADELEFAAIQALNELGWSCPVTNPKKEFWCVQRGKRHALDLLRTVSAHKFKYKQISLHHRFEHYNAMIEKMDNDFRIAMDTDPILLDIDIANFFGTYIENGIVYTQFGEDVSKLLNYYGIDNKGFRQIRVNY